MSDNQESKSDTWRAGVQVRRQVLGDEYVDRAL
ncbi:MAG: hypothetical protein RL322_3101, partial [Pseudomonadota bacterium]